MAVPLLFCPALDLLEHGPAHALALALDGSQVKHSCSFSAGSREAGAYLRGESIEWDSPDKKGWFQVQVDGFPLGWAKLAGGMLKNHFPKGLRWNG